MTNIIQVNKLSKSFQYHKKSVGVKASIANLFRREMLTKEAVKNISFDVKEGEIVGFIGANGAGKTTTLKMLSGILFPDSGDATIMGYVPWERKNEFKRNFSIVMGQKQQLLWDLPANESINLNKNIYGVDDRAYESRLGELSEMLDCSNLLDVRVRNLSLGEKMKMELIAALIHSPRIIFLDEPTIGLDIQSQKKIREFLRDYNKKEKATIILTSHYMEDIEELTKRSIVINKGEVVFDGDIQQVNDSINKKNVVLEFSKKIIMSELAVLGEIKENDEFTATIQVEKDKINQIVRELIDNYPLVDFVIKDIGIEEILPSLYSL